VEFLGGKNEQAQFCSRLKSGKLTIGDLPEGFELCGRIVQEIDELWKQMVNDPDHKEQGACILFDWECSFRLDGIADDQSPFHVTPRCRAWDCDDHMGFFHTHWYLGGEEQVGFSGNDFAGFLQDGESLSVVRSGNQIFALMRTNATPEPFLVSEHELVQFRRTFLYYHSTELSQAEAQLKANRKICQELGMAFYRALAGGALKLDYESLKQLKT
jgi:hypothetical protein